MNTKIRPSIWLAFSGLALAGLGGLISTATSSSKPHYDALITQLDGGPIWDAFGQTVTTGDIFWGYAYSGPFTIIVWAFVLLFAVRAAPSLQASPLFLWANLAGALGLLAFLISYLLLIGQILVGLAVVGFGVALWQCRAQNRKEA